MFITSGLVALTVRTKCSEQATPRLSHKIEQPVGTRLRLAALFLFDWLRSFYWPGGNPLPPISSTLLRVISDEAETESGEVRRGKGVRISFLDQQASLPPGTVRNAVGESWEADSVIDRLGMTPFLDVDVSELSGGEAKRVALAKALLAESDLLILDEPTNHLDMDAIAWLEDRLAQHRRG
ncbi:MAG: ATP-binding cassette domain-containing protein, partial [Acidimicrobiales bacterium]